LILSFRFFINSTIAGKKKQQKKNSGEKRRQFSPLSEIKTLTMDKSVKLATETG